MGSGILIRHDYIRLVDGILGSSYYSLKSFLAFMFYLFSGGRVDPIPQARPSGFCFEIFEKNVDDKNSSDRNNFNGYTYGFSSPKSEIILSNFRFIENRTGTFSGFSDTILTFPNSSINSTARATDIPIRTWLENSGGTKYKYSTPVRMKIGKFLLTESNNRFNKGFMVSEIITPQGPIINQVATPATNAPPKAITGLYLPVRRYKTTRLTNKDTIDLPIFSQLVFPINPPDTILTEDDLNIFWVNSTNKMIELFSSNDTEVYRNFGECFDVTLDLQFFNISEKIKEKNAGSNRVWFITPDLLSFSTRIRYNTPDNYLSVTIDEAGVAEYGLTRPTYDRVSLHGERGFEISQNGNPSASVKNIITLKKFFYKILSQVGKEFNELIKRGILDHKGRVRGYSYSSGEGDD